MKKVIALSVVLILVLTLAPSFTLTKSNGDLSKPLPAVNVELVKKAIIKGKPAGKGKPTKNVATGVLGELCSGNRYAIIVGISDYPGTENDLNYADDDAIDTYNTLISVYGFDPDNIVLLLDLDATFSAIYNAVQDVESKAQPGDEVVFFFSGHGARGRVDDGDKEPIDEAIVSHNGIELVYIWDGQLRDWFSDFSTSRIIFIFDSCLSGGMTDLSANGRVISMASTENGLSYESSALQNGVFTYFFVQEGMYNGNADVYDHDDDGVTSEPSDVTIEEAFDYAKVHVEDYVSRQRPTISDLFENDLLP